MHINNTFMKETAYVFQNYTQKLKATIQQRGCPSRGWEWGLDMAEEHRGKISTPERALLKLMTMVNHKTRDEENSTPWGRGWCPVRAREPNRKSGRMRHGRDTGAQRTAFAVTKAVMKCHLQRADAQNKIHREWREKADFGIRAWPRAGRGISGGRDTRVVRCWLPGRSSRAQWCERIMTVRWPWPVLDPCLPPDTGE